MAEELTTTAVAGAYRLARGAQVQSTLAEWVNEPASRLDILQAQNCVPRTPNTALPTIASSSVPNSMRVSVNSGPVLSSLASTNVPVLDSQLSTLSSSLSSSRESRSQPNAGGSIVHSARPPNGIANAGSSSGTYPCPFHFLNCSLSFQRRHDWTLHSLSHFRGSAPPATVRCPYPSCRWPAESGPTGWDTCMDHIADHIHRGERLDSSCRPDPGLLSHLRSIRVLGMVQYQELVRGGTTVACEMNNPRRDYRQRGLPGPATRCRRGND